MRKQWKCEWKKTRGRHILLIALLITAVGLCWTLHGNYDEKVLQEGWMIFLYQMPLTNAIFFPMLSIVVASLLCGLEHKGKMLKQLGCMTPMGKLYDGKLLYGLGIVSICVMVQFITVVSFGFLKGFDGVFPAKLYGFYLLFTIVPTIALYIFQHTLSMLFANQSIPFFAGVIGEFAGIFSMFLPQFPWLRKSLLWGYYGVLQFVGMFGWSKDKRDMYYFEVMPIDWMFFFVLIVVILFLYGIGRKLFCEREV